MGGAADVTIDPIDSLGALPFDTYEVSELHVAANEGLELATFEVTVSRHGTNVDDSEGPHIETELNGREGEHITKGDHDMTLTDTVWYENLEPERKYTVNGTLMDKATGEAIEGATVSAALTPEEPSGTVDVTFEVDASGLSGHGLVAFERVSWQGHVVAMHEDLADEGQTVRVVSTGTTATDKADGDHTVSADKVEIDDAVSYVGLTLGTEYALTGTLMDKETGKPVTDGSGKPVTASVAFTPDKADGRVTVTFTLDASGLGGHDLVAFEVLAQGRPR